MSSELFADCVPFFLRMGFTAGLLRDFVILGAVYAQSAYEPIILEVGVPAERPVLSQEQKRTLKRTRGPPLTRFEPGVFAASRDVPAGPPVSSGRFSLRSFAEGLSMVPRSSVKGCLDSRGAALSKEAARVRGSRAGL